jgi:hypothetical protein
MQSLEYAPPIEDHGLTVIHRAQGVRLSIPIHSSPALRGRLAFRLLAATAVFALGTWIQWVDWRDVHMIIVLISLTMVYRFVPYRIDISKTHVRLGYWPLSWAIRRDRVASITAGARAGTLSLHTPLCEWHTFYLGVEGEAAHQMAAAIERYVRLPETS